MAAKCSDCGCYVQPYIARCRSCEDAHEVTPEEVALVRTGRQAVPSDGS